MQRGRKLNRILGVILIIAVAALLFAQVGCSARGTCPPVVERVGHPPTRLGRDTLRIATANLWGVSVLGFDWADDIDERFAAMAERLARNQPALDIVLIQEAWKDAARHALLEHAGVARAFPYRVDVVDRPGGAGLVILSGFPIESAHFHRFRAQGRCIKFWEGDCISGKGILIIQIVVGGRSFWIGDTHLIACYSSAEESEMACDLTDPNGDDRWQQTLEARRAIETLAGDDPIVLGGDFNFTRTSRYYRLMTREEFPSETPAPQAASSASSALSESQTTNSPRGWGELSEDTDVPNRLDYLWSRPGTEFRWHPLKAARPIFTEPVLLRSDERVPLSDHPILATEFCLVRVDDPDPQCLALTGIAGDAGNAKRGSD